MQSFHQTSNGAFKEATMSAILRTGHQKKHLIYKQYMMTFKLSFLGVRMSSTHQQEATKMIPKQSV